MSTTYSVVCDDCKQAYWAAQSSSIGKVRFYDSDKVCDFLVLHFGHNIKLVVDMVEPYDEYEQVMK